MVHVYYHIYAIDGVEDIITEQLNLIKKHFDFPYTLNVGISIAKENQSISHILKIVGGVRDVRTMGNEFTTLDLIEKDKDEFGDSDYILYIHTKGASKRNDINYENIISWRHLMNYFNIEKAKDVFKLFERSDFNTHGVLLSDGGGWKLYSGNFWWAKASYVKELNFQNVKKRNRYQAEWNFISVGENWKPYSSYNVNERNHYSILFKREEYAK
jgi:hypothetical protein